MHVNVIGFVLEVTCAFREVRTAFEETIDVRKI